jgi:hypothetical protein
VGVARAARAKLQYLLDYCAISRILASTQAAVQQDASLSEPGTNRASFC